MACRWQWHEAWTFGILLPGYASDSLRCLTGSRIFYSAAWFHYGNLGRQLSYVGNNVVNRDIRTNVQ